MADLEAQNRYPQISQPIFARANLPLTLKVKASSFFFLYMLLSHMHEPLMVHYMSRYSVFGWRKLISLIYASLFTNNLLKPLLVPHRHIHGRSQPSYGGWCKCPPYSRSSLYIFVLSSNYNSNYSLNVLLIKFLKITLYINLPLVEMIF